MFGGLFWGVFHWLQTRKSMRAFPIYSRKTTKWPFFSKVENFHEMMKNVLESRCTSHFCKISQKYIFNMDLPTLVSYKLNLSISAISDNVYQVFWPFEKIFMIFMQNFNWLCVRFSRSILIRFWRRSKCNQILPIRSSPIKRILIFCNFYHGTCHPNFVEFNRILNRNKDFFKYKNTIFDSFSC